MIPVNEKNVIDQGKVVVVVEAVGIRKHGDKKDVCSLARKIDDLLLKQGR